ncbi:MULTISPECIES: ABC transporter permease [Thermodesulfovibrio]|jgi:ABC-2 type transport system permease protein|uniref:ABC transporter permease n=1 Tax=Thermodesulfovibrio TaxID=28261 RepID=UPI00262C1301|nr:ABC transporter permease [Thermodesulfovibrio sp.]
MRLLTLIKKEITHLIRDKALIFILLWAFTGAVYTSGSGFTMEVRNFPTIIYDMNNTKESREIIDKFRKPYFKIISQIETEKELTEWLDSGKASMAVIIPPDFSRKINENKAKIQVIVDGTMSISATVAIAYVSEITYGYALEVLEREKLGLTAVYRNLPVIEEKTTVEFNPNTLSSWFMSMLEYFNMITMVCLLVTAAAMVREKEQGTIEQLLVTPVRTWEIFFAKIIPTVLSVAILSPLTIYGILKGVFGVPLRGSIFLFYLVMLFYAFTISSLGLVISTIAKNLAQSMMLMLVILIPMLFLSGAWTPPESMQAVMRNLSLLSPMRYFIDFGYSVLFKGNGIENVWHDILGIILIGGILFVFSVYRFRKIFIK